MIAEPRDDDIDGLRARLAEVNKESANRRRELKEAGKVIARVAEFRSLVRRGLEVEAAVRVTGLLAED